MALYEAKLVTSAPASVPVRPHADVSNVGIPPTADIAFIDVGPEMVPVWVCWVFFAFLNVEPGSISLHIWCTCLARKVPYPLCLLGGGGESTCKRGIVFFSSGDAKSHISYEKSSLAHALKYAVFR